MRKRKTVKIVMAMQPEANRFDEAKVKTFIPKKKWANQSHQNALDFEQFLWDNAGATFYETLQNAMNERRQK